MKRNEFKTYHPIVNFAYFLFVIGFSIFFMHPVCLIISSFCAMVYSTILKGVKSLKKNILPIILILILMPALNSALNHNGITILCYLPGGNPLTAQSLYYGFFAALLLIETIYWFSCFSEVITSDKFIYIFGRISPALSLVLSMSLRFVPLFTSRIKEVLLTQKCAGNYADKKITGKIKSGLKILSITITWSLENAIDTSDSMKSRGWGIKKRSSFSNFIFDRRDFFMLFLILSLAAYIIYGAISGVMDFSFFPSVSKIELTPFTLSIFLSFATLCFMPVIIEWKEALKWNIIKSRI